VYRQKVNENRNRAKQTQNAEWRERYSGLLYTGAGAGEGGVMHARTNEECRNEISRGTQQTFQPSRMYSEPVEMVAEGRMKV